MKTLELIAELRATLQKSSNTPDYRRWLELATKLETSLEWDVKCCATERKLMERIREGISQVYSAYSNGMIPDFGRAAVPLKALENLVRTRIDEV